MPDTTIPGTALVPTTCCSLHKPGGWSACCNTINCAPCCERCPTCPAVMFPQDWAGLDALGDLIDAVIGGRP